MMAAMSTWVVAAAAAVVVVVAAGVWWVRQVRVPSPLTLACARATVCADYTVA
jgi:hypothetical protein